MKIRSFKEVLNRYFFKYVDGNNRPVFFDIDKTYPQLNEVTRHYQIIKTEFDNAYQTRNQLPNYHDIDPGEYKISNTTEKNWKVFMLYLLGHKAVSNRELCPETSRILDTIPDMIQAFFSILEPGKTIPLHKGPYLGYLRYHLGLQIPKQNPPKLWLNSQEYTWKSGEAVLFDDTWPHAVENHSNEVRAVLIIDVLRPMPTVPSLINKIAANFLARHTYGRQVMNRVKQYSGELD